MQEYKNKAALIAEINKTAEAFILEFEAIPDADGDTHIEGVDRTPKEMIAYQLGWMALIRSWDADELAGKEVITPVPGVKWNQMALLHQKFYDAHCGKPLSELRKLFAETITDFIQWFDCFAEEEVFTSGGRKWASSTPSNWPIWKWVHINTVAPFKSFRSQIRKWKKAR